MPLYGNFGEDVRDENDRRPLLRDDERPAERAVPMPNYYRTYERPRTPQEPDLATRVAADIYAFNVWRAGGDEDMMRMEAREAIRKGRIFAEAVAKEGK